jgi:hypothetical protein
MIVVASVPPLAALAAPGSTDPEVARQLAKVREVTTRYHDINNAIADGFIRLSPCLANPAGTMGFHYGRVDRMLDQEIKAEEPELLLYAPSGNGMRLVAVEYYVPFVGQSAPTLFGEKFKGPMAGHGPMPRPDQPDGPQFQPVHYDHHVWVWQANPEGTVTDWNPYVRCG